MYKPDSKGALCSGDWFAVDVNDLAAQLLFLVPRNQVVGAVLGSFPQQGGAGAGGTGNGQKFDNSGSKKSGRFFCSQFNKGSCPHAGSHKAVVAGRLRTVDHICATCLLYFDEIQLHPELECPRASAKGKNPSSFQGADA